MRLINFKYLQIVIVLAIICLPTLLHAQPGFDDDVTDDVPIDGGLSLLLAAGVGYGAKKLHERKQTKQQKNK